jgi:hypothetical protein
MRPEEQDARDGAWRAQFAEVLGEYRAVTGEAAPARPQRTAPADPQEAAQWAMAGYLDGPTLSEVVGVLGPLPPSVVAALAVGLAEALSEIHAVGVVRGDLQPNNVLLAEDGPRLRVAGFGIAAAADGGAVAEAGWAFDDPGYLAPEQVLGLPSGPAADVFSLGTVLFYAAGGAPPFRAEGPNAVLFQVVHEEPPLDGIPVVLRGLVKACLSKDPAQRPALQTVIDRAVGVLADAATATGLDGAAQDVLYPETVFPDTVFPEAAVFPETALPETVLPEAARPAEALLDGAYSAEEYAQAGYAGIGYRETLAPEEVFPESAFPEAGFPDAVFPEPGFAEAGFSADAFAKAGYPEPKQTTTTTTQTAAMPSVEPELTTVLAPLPAGPDGPRRPRSASRRHGRSRLVGVLTLGVVIAVGVGVGSAFLLHTFAHTNTAAAARPSPTATRARAPLPGTFLAGPGCAASPWSGTSQSVANNTGFVPAAGGGAADCGGQAVAFVKSGNTAPGATSFTWSFKLGWSARCTLSVFVANAAPSSGIAQYRLYVPASKTATGVTATFQINQGKAKGQWVAVPALNNVSLPDGAVQLTLTDIGSFAGDRFHVTASAVRAVCSQVP